MISARDADLLLAELKTTVRPMEWQNKPGQQDPQWMTFFSACEIDSSIIGSFVRRENLPQDINVALDFTPIPDHAGLLQTIALRLGNRPACTSAARKVGDTPPPAQPYPRGASDPIYVVQTNTEIIQRCLLMTTDPGKLGNALNAYTTAKWDEGQFELD